MSKGRNKRQKWITSIPVGAHDYCRACSTLKPALDFFDLKSRKPMKTCYACLCRRRQKMNPRSVGQDKGHRTYSDYINSADWRRKKEEYWLSGEYKACYVCDRERHAGMHIHHRTYKRLGNEDLNDLVPVCEEHHNWISKRWVDEKKLNKKRKHTERLTLWQVTDLVRDDYRGGKPC